MVPIFISSVYIYSQYNVVLNFLSIEGGGTNIGVLKGEENAVKKEGSGSGLGRGGTLGDLSSLAASSSGLSLQSLLGPPKPDLKPKPDLLSTALSSSGKFIVVFVV